MKMNELLDIVQVLEESVDWDNETLSRCPKIFLLVRQTYLDCKEDEKYEFRQKV